MGHGSNGKPGQMQLDALRQAVREEPDSARAHMRLGTGLLQLGNVAEAERELRRALELDGALVEAWVNLAGALFSRWDFKGCVEANGRAIAANPRLARPHYNQGLGYLYLGEAEKMLDCFNKVVEIEEDSAGGHYHRAVALHALERDEEARASLRLAQALGYKAEPNFLKAMGYEAGGTVPAIEIGPGCKTGS